MNSHDNKVTLVASGSEVEFFSFECSCSIKRE